MLNILHNFVTNANRPAKMLILKYIKTNVIL